MIPMNDLITNKWKLENIMFGKHNISKEAEFEVSLICLELPNVKHRQISWYSTLNKTYVQHRTYFFKSVLNMVSMDQILRLFLFPLPFPFSSLRVLQ